MPKLKKVYTEKYTVISNRVLDDEELGWKAKGLGKVVPLLSFCEITELYICPSMA